MLKLKKTAIAVLALGSSAVFAGTMGPVCAPGNVTVPCERTAWDFGAQALYLQPSVNGLGYAGSTQVGTVATYNEHAYRWGWGFMIEGSYHFNTGNDLNLNWYHWNRSATITPGAGFSNSTAVTSYFPDVALQAKPKWDAVNLEFGQHVDFGDARFVRFHGGAQYARINTRRALAAGGYTTAAGVSTPGAVAIERNLTYNGFGPRVGADLVYGFGNGLGIYAKAASALLVGSQGFNTAYTPVAINPLLHTYSSGSRTQIVPEVESKLGAQYTYSMAQGDLSLDAGWMWLNYFNASHVGRGFGTETRADFGLQGPFVGLKWVGNVA